MFLIASGQVLIRRERLSAQILGKSVGAGGRLARSDKRDIEREEEREQ
jgi:hypothetical protein